MESCFPAAAPGARSSGLLVVGRGILICLDCDKDVSHSNLSGDAIVVGSHELQELEGAPGCGSSRFAPLSGWFRRILPFVLTSHAATAAAPQVSFAAADLGNLQGVRLCVNSLDA
jgi:hypothetical protein